VTHTNNFCEKLRKEDPEMRELIKEFHQGTKTKDNLRELFEKKFKGASADIKNHCGIED
jgi:hypothetical protein